MIASISPDSALRFSGRFMVTTRVWPSSSTRQCGCPRPRGVLMVTMLARNKNVF